MKQVKRLLAADAEAAAEGCAIGRETVMQLQARKLA
jgi:hypothetical protein